MKLYIFDLDGVIYIGNSLLPGVKKTLKELERRGERICFLSNNSTLSRKGYCKKFRRWHLNIKEEQIFPSSYLCAIYLKRYERITPDKKIMVIGERGIFEELKREKIKITRHPEKTDYVVVGMDRRLTFRKLCLAYWAILKGAKFIATNADLTYPLEKTTIPASGAIVKALEVSTGKSPLLLGKPETFGLKMLLECMNFSPSQAILVGDRLETDIALGNRMGIKTVLVLSGITSEKDLEKTPPSCQPSYVIKSLPQLLSLKL